MKIAPYQAVALNNPYDHFAFFAGIASGKTFTGSHFVIKMISNHPECTGLIGANSYDQLSQATLRELFYWLEFYKFEFVVNRMPPREWNEPKKFAVYRNLLCVRNPRTGKVTYIFIRIMSDENPLRGIEFTWYWLDETRDTPQDTHDVVLSRLRENTWTKGMITTTTNGEDWSYERFVKNGNDLTMLYGSMHIPTIESVNCGFITQKFYDTLRRTYTPLMAMQELDAQHVNVRGGAAYYAAGSHNKLITAPWGEASPNRDRPLIVGCDFNYSPAPCVWMVGQLGPNIYGPKGEQWWKHIHWFGEIAETQTSTPEMTLKLVSRFPGFFYRVFGDATGGKGTTSNAGKTDYDQMSATLTDAGALYSIDYDQANPHVKDRVENMNGKLKNAMGEVSMTYNPQACPLFDQDMKMVGWKVVGLTGKGRLDNAGNVQLTHASDGAGYAVWKLFPPLQRGRSIESLPSMARAELEYL